MAMGRRESEHLDGVAGSAPLHRRLVQEPLQEDIRLLYAEVQLRNRDGSEEHAGGDAHSPGLSQRREFRPKRLRDEPGGDHPLGRQGTLQDRSVRM